MKKVSCIICTYNEETRISRVLKVVSDHPLINEVIVVDDCSTDNTVKDVLRFKGVKLIRHKKNLGKSLSMRDGCNKTKNDLIIFLDVDLVGLTQNNITHLIKPVIDGLVDMTISMRKNTFFLYKILGHDFISGERVIKKDAALKILKDVPGYGAEVKINQYILDNNLKFLVVRWSNVTHTTKQKKEGIIKGWFHDLIMFKQIFNVVPFFEFVKQMLIMSWLSVGYKKELKNKIPQ